MVIAGPASRICACPPAPRVSWFPLIELSYTHWAECRIRTAGPHVRVGVLRTSCWAVAVWVSGDRRPRGFTCRVQAECVCFRSVGLFGRERGRGW
jgi:hypothetical protein